MQAGRHFEIIQDQPGQKTEAQQAQAGDGERKPEQEQEIKVGHDKAVQVGHLVQHIHLYQDKDRKPADIRTEKTSGFYLLRLKTAVNFNSVQNVFVVENLQRAEQIQLEQDTETRIENQ